jgi:hypothetical protein
MFPLYQCMILNKEKTSVTYLCHVQEKSSILQRYGTYRNTLWWLLYRYQYRTQHLGPEILVYCLVITVVIWIRTWRTCCRGRRRQVRSPLWTTHLWPSSWACDRTRSPAAASVTPRSHQASKTKPNQTSSCNALCRVLHVARHMATARGLNSKRSHT